MANTKISGATAVTTPAATDEYPTNQGGVSKKTTRAQMHALESGEHLVIPQVDEAATPTLSFGDGDTGFYESADDTLGVAFNGIVKWTWSSSVFQRMSNGPAMRNAVPSATNPVFCPHSSDLDTGVGWQGADNLALIAGGLEAVRAEDPADLAATETSLWLYDLDNGAVQQVTVGAADSGGSGYKVLRIPN